MPRAGCRGGGRLGIHGLRGKQRLAALGAAHAAGLGATIPETRKRDLGCSIRGQLVESKERQNKTENQLIV